MMNTSGMPVVEDTECNEMVVRLRDHSLPIIEEWKNGVKLSQGTYTHEDFAEAILGSLDTDPVCTPILPRGALYYGESARKTHVFIEIPPHQRKAFYHEAVLEDVPFPRLVCGFQLVKREEKLDITNVYLAALEDQIIPNEDSKVYSYPYTNVRSDFSVCWGSQKLPSLDRVSQLSTIPEIFFNSPNSDCYFSTANTSNAKNYRELVEKIKGQAFPEKYLKPTGHRLNDWINAIVGA